MEITQLEKGPKFTFQEQTIQAPYLKETTVLASLGCPINSKHIYIFTDHSEIVRLNIDSGEHDLIATLDANEFPVTAKFHLYCSQDGRFLALTCRRRSTHELSPLCKGIVIRQADGETVMALSAGDYHTEQAPLPLCFLEYEGRTLLVHATDWNRLDITDMDSGKIITERNFEDSPGRDEDNDDLYTEWYGLLKPSPNNSRMATIGWVWHPIGIALSFDLKAWLNGSTWESDCSPRMRDYAIWDYYWDSPFCWVDDQKLCIWGVSDGEFGDDPKNEAAIFDAESGDKLLSIPGPTCDTFFCDEYLFSGLQVGEERQMGLTIWSLKDASLLYKKQGLFADLYVPEEKALIAFDKNGEITINRWTVSS